MLKKTISIFFLLTAGFLLFLAARALTNLRPPTAINDIDTLKKQTIDYLRQDRQIDANTAIKTILANFTSDAKLSSVVYDIAEAYRNSSKFANSIELYKYIVVNQPASRQAEFAQSGLAISNVAIGNLEAAKGELEKLKSNYATEPNIAQLVFNVGDAFYWFNHLKDANDIYAQVIKFYPSSEYAMWATMGLAISSISNKDDESAEIYINKLSTEYAENSRLPEALYYVATKYGYNRNYKKANDIYYVIKTKWPENNWSKNSAFETAKIGVFQYLDVKDEPNTIKAVVKLIADFNRPDLPAVVLDIAARSDWQNKYEPTGLTTKLYKIILKHFSSSPQMVSASLSLDRTNLIPILDKNDVNVVEIVEKFLDEHKNATNLFGEVSKLAEHYYLIVGKYPKNREYAANCARNRLVICERIIERFPDSFDKARAYKIAADVYQARRQNLEALGYYQKILDTYPNYSETGQILFSIAQSYNYMMRTGQIEPDGAFPLMKDAYERIVQFYPGSPPARAARSNLIRLEEQQQGGI